jgi:electron-transferring-flavoprotein dehydrogenase
VVDPIALNELLPNWRDSPLTVPVVENHHWVLSASGKTEIPHFMMPSFMNNVGTYTVSLGSFCRWLASQAESLGVEIFPGFAAAEVLFDPDGTVKGVATGDMGIARDGEHMSDFTRHGASRQHTFAEGPAGT